jgi:heat shock protein HslJ
MKQLIILFIILLFLYNCSSTSEIKKETEKNIFQDVDSVVLSSFYQNKFIQGADFFARGNEPFWTIEIESEKEIKFSSLFEVNSIITIIKQIELKANNEINFHAQNDSLDLKVTIIKQSCEDNMSGELFDYKVKVDLRKMNETTHNLFEGCGRYLYDYRLNNIWILQEITGVEPNLDKLMKNNPMFEFDLKQMKFRVHNSCNYLMGKIELMGKQLSFDVVINTKKTCSDPEAESTIVNAINKKTFTYNIKNQELVLENKQGIKIVFIKS